MYRSLALALLLLGLSTTLALAGDIVAMPTGNTVAPGHVQLHYIYWDQEPISTPGGDVRDFSNIYEVHVGVVDRVEIDYLSVSPQGLDTMNELNLYFTAIKETPQNPSLIIGATNITEADWLPSTGRPMGDNRASVFVVGAYNLRVPQGGPPSLQDPLVRGHLGYGNGFHQDSLFGGIQVALSPQFGVGVFNYQSEMAYLGSWIPFAGMEVNAGWSQGSPLIHLSYDMAIWGD